MKMKHYEIEFTNVNTINAQHIANADGQVRQMLNELNPTKDTSERETFKEQMNNLQSGLSGQGAYPFDDMYIIRKLYIQRRARQEGATVKSMVHYSRVFDAVVSSALTMKARTLTKEEAKDFDYHRQDLNEEHGIFFTPQIKEGEQWLPTSMEAVAFIDDDVAGEWSAGDEPYAGTSFLEMI